jgi:hypothetical protein
LLRCRIDLSVVAYQPQKPTTGSQHLMTNNSLLKGYNDSSIAYLQFSLISRYAAMISTSEDRT